MLQLVHRSRDFRMTAGRRSSIVAGAFGRGTERIVGITGTSRARGAGKQDSENDSTGETQSSDHRNSPPRRNDHRYFSGPLIHRAAIYHSIEWSAATKMTKRFKSRVKPIN